MAFIDHKVVETVYDSSGGVTRQKVRYYVGDYVMVDWLNPQTGAFEQREEYRRTELIQESIYEFSE